MINENVDLAMLAEGDEALQEGILRQMGGGMADGLKYTGRSVAALFKPGEGNVAKAEELLADLVKWLQDYAKEHDKLDLTKVSDLFKTNRFDSAWRYYFIVDDKTWGEFHEAVASKDTFMDANVDLQIKKRADANAIIDRAKDMGELIAIAKKAESRAKEAAAAIRKRDDGKVGYKAGAILYGAAEDLTIVLKRVARLAV